MSKVYNRFYTALFCLFSIVPLLKFIFLKLKLYLPIGYLEIFFWMQFDRALLFIGIITVLIAVLTHNIRISTKLTENKVDPTVLLFLAVMSLMTISTLFTGWDDTVFHGTEMNFPEGLIANLGYFVFFLVVIKFSSEKCKKILLGVIAGAALIPQASLVLDLYLNETAGIANVIFDHFNHMGYYLTVTVMLSEMLLMISKKTWQKIASVIAIIIGIQAVILNNTLGAYLGVFAGTIFIPIVYTIINKKVRLSYFFPLIISVATVIVASCISEDFAYLVTTNLGDLGIASKAAMTLRTAPESAGTGRIGIYRGAWAAVKEHPIWGLGWQASMECIYEASNQYCGLCHCEYLSYALIYGVPVAVTYLAAILSVFIRGLIHKNELTEINIIGLCVAFAYCVGAVSGNPMFFTAPFFFMMLGLGYWQQEKKQEAPIETDANPLIQSQIQEAV